jgi:serine/threonine protein kinase
MPQGRYLLHKRIARGGMAEIYLGKQVGEDGFERVCCIKRVLPHYAEEKEFIEMFRDEAHIGKRLQHANIVRVEGFEEVEGSFAIIMEFINGGDLRSLLSNCEKAKVRFSVPMAVFIIAESARGLHFAHTKKDEITGEALGIVHRDISPQNILISFEGEVKVTDFGIADAESKETETKPGIVKGKYSYMSPEQISAKPVDARTDVFALAILLWEMLAMKRLFHAENEVDTIQLVKNCVIQYDLGTLNPLVDEDLQRIIKTGLAKETKDRYASAAAFEKDLRIYLNKHYSNFTPQDLGNFIKKLLDKKREELAQDIKELLSKKRTEQGFSGTDQENNNKKQDVKSTTSISAKDSEAKSDGRAVSSPKGLQADKSPKPFSQREPVLPVTPARNSWTPQTPPQAARSTWSPNSAAPYGGNSPSSSSVPRRPALARGQEQKSQGGLGKYFFIALLLCSVLAGGYFFKEKFEGKGPTGFTITTIPEVVKLSLDDTPLFDGKYVKTSLVINKIPPGHHGLKVAREGFSDELIEFTIKDGEQLKSDDLVLKQTVPMAPTKITVEEGVEGVKVDLDDGLATAVVSHDDPMRLEYLTFGVSHSIAVFPNFPSTDGSFTCRFIPRAQNWQAPFLVLIESHKQKCSYPFR